jgi:BirA family transcriptional regulator, biotin operon repressor / biotin---[acetyl-CoA-carboxylase] ligase
LTTGEATWDGIGCAEWAQRHELPLFEAHATIGSTNQRLRALADAGAEPFTVVVSNEQTAGRGRGGKLWVSPPGGLWVSILVPSSPGLLGQVVPLVAGLAVARSVKHVTGVDVGLKWPNDVLIGAEKLAGILCEVAPGGSVVTGVGINLRAPEAGWPDDLVERPCALTDHLKWPLADLRSALLGGFFSEMASLLRSQSMDDFTRLWSPLDALSGREVVCSMGAEGVACGIDEEGSLLVETVDGLIAVRAGGVRLKDQSCSTQDEKVGPE